MIKDHLLERTALTSGALTHADADGDGLVGMADVVWVINHRYGTITIDVTPDSGSWGLAGPAGFTSLTGSSDRLGGSAIKGPPGDYVLTCNDNVADYDPPSTETKTLAAGGAIAFTPVYTPEVGQVTINVTPDAGSWTLTGPAGFTTINGSGDRLDGSVITNAPVGDYRLTCHDNVTSYNPPARETKTLTGHGTIAFTPAYTPETWPPEITITLPGNVPLVLVRIPAGSFQMGSPDTERSRWSDEGPTHTVNIAYSSYMGKYEVTQGQWLALMGSWPDSTYNPPNYPECGLGDNYPAYFISWNDAQNFIAALNTHVTNTGQALATFRLPSEAEWEYACRAGTQTRFFFGDSLSADDYDTDGPAETLPGNRSDYLWFWFNCQGNANGAYGSKPVGTKLPNQFGLYDMSGNLWEWCQDWWHGSYTGAPTDGSAWESPTAGSRIVRGGNWSGFADYCRSAYRYGLGPGNRFDNIGFRLSWTQ
jgi:formylglycine-generating enzyme required for sulfatase activity